MVGQAGPGLANRLTHAGMTVALLERKLFGGTCANTGCTPNNGDLGCARNNLRRAFHRYRRSR
jgi:pyruvate/2-oxoglutarate dehydrogenase complex dihydrolipoamide dehydrogenase (E3) component